jgi:hypothetical protein
MKTLLPLLFILLTLPGITQTCDPEFFFSTQLVRPQGIATDGDQFWVSEREGGFSLLQLNLYDEAGNYVQTLIDEAGNLDNSFFCLEVYADTLYVVREQLGQLQKMHKTTGELYATFDLPTLNSNVDPNNTGITHDGTYLWNAEHDFLLQQSYLFKMDPHDGAVLDTLFLDITWLFPLEIINGKLLGLSIEEEILYEIDMATGESEFIANWCLDDPFGMAYDALNNALYAVDESTDGDGGVYKIVGLDLPSTTIDPSAQYPPRITLSPNPAADYLLLELDSPLLQPGNLELYHTNGQRVLAEPVSTGAATHTLDLSALPEGLYFLRMNIGRGTLVETLLIGR